MIHPDVVAEQLLYERQHRREVDKVQELVPQAENVGDIMDALRTASGKFFERGIKR